ncbi:AAA family ATPase [Marinivivus vitaminiproducens]|uniref:ATP-binding protein n=1 Tax=Marinivivus vitaminiproducens TaxID=3035935 RepID=UPI0027A795D1|nr:AAA family ATPase [Geminicoccaceae bacterium SCSIO 64248]
MRLERLHLLRYGPFTEREVPLPDADLCLVFGVNEAGKTSALRAVADLLFGFEARTAADFRHDYGQLRIGGTLSRRDGTTLSFRRRKGNVRTLLTESETPLDDDALAPFLAGIDRARFLHAFGLSQAGLRDGSKAIIAAGGDSASGLFGAASGLSHVGEIERVLNAEAQAIFTGRRSAERRFYQALDRYDSARKELGRTSLRVDAWQAALDAAERTEAERAERNAAHEALVLRQSRVGRLRRVLPHLRRIDELTEALAPLADQADLPEDVGRNRLDLLQRRVLVQADLRRREDALAALDADREALQPPGAIVDQADTVEALAARRGTVGKAAAARPRLEAAVQAQREALDRLSRELGVPDRAALDERRPVAAVRADLARLLREAGGRRAERDAARETRQSAARHLDALERERASLGPMTDPTPMRRRLSVLASAAANAEDLQAVEREAAAASAEFDQALARLAPWLVPAERLVQLPVPAREAIRAHGEERERVDRRLERIETEREAEASKADAARQALAELRAGGEVPTSDAVQAERTERDRLWRRVRRRAEHPGKPVDEPLPDLLDTYERAMRTADMLADRREVEASRVARFAAETANLEMAEQRLARLDTDRAEAVEAIDAWQEAWLRIWAPCGIDPGPPAAMREWLDLVEAARRRHAELRQADALADARRANRQAALDDLRSLGAELDLAVTDGEAEAVEVALQSREAAWSRAVALTAQITNARGHCDASRIEEARKGEAFTAWREQWDRALAALGLPGGIEPAVAAASLELWQGVPEALNALSRDERALADADAEIAGFRQDAETAIAKLAPDLAAIPVGEAVAVLAGRLAAARTLQTRHAELARHRSQAEQGLAQAKAEALAVQDALAGLFAVAGVTDDEALAQAIADSDRKRSLTAELAEMRRRLAADADGVAEAELAAEAAGADPDHLRLEDERVAAELAQSVAALGDARAEVEAAQAEMRRMGEGQGAETHAQAMADAVAELTELSRDWARLRTAAILVRAGLERYRKRTESPLLTAAGRHFTRLTCGRFAGLAADYDRNDQPSLVAVRDDGERVGVEGLSEGTCDQLYLALRLAELERFSASAEPLPFLGDDLFVSFDDERAVAGLEVLADVGRSSQMLLFTHHRHLVELGRQALGERLAVVDLSAD